MLLEIATCFIDAGHYHTFLEKDNSQSVIIKSAVPRLARYICCMGNTSVDKLLAMKEWVSEFTS